MTSSLGDRLSAVRRGDRQAAEDMLLENAGLIWSVARRFFGRGVDADDLFQLGCIGFIKAMEGFDDSYGTRFSTYAVPKIAGEIRRFLRDDGTVKVSRSIKERTGLIRGARMLLEQRLGREPTLSEVSAETGFAVDDIVTCDTASCPTESLQRENGDGGLTLESVLGDERQEERLVEHISLRAAIEHLSRREQTIIMLRYYRGMTQQDTARIIGISQVQVSRIEKRALSAIRSEIE